MPEVSLAAAAAHNSAPIAALAGARLDLAMHKCRHKWGLWHFPVVCYRLRRMHSPSMDTQLPHALDLHADSGRNLGKLRPHRHMIGSSRLQSRSLPMLVEIRSQAFPKATGRSTNHIETSRCLCPWP